MASVFVVRSRRPLLHYYSYPARRGYHRTAGNYSRIRWIKPTCTLRERGLRREARALNASSVYARGVTVDVARCRTTRKGDPSFLSMGHVNQSGTICRPSSARTYECNNEDIVKKCLSVQPTFRTRVYRRQLRRAATSCDELPWERRQDVRTGGRNFFFNGCLYWRK